MGSEIFVVGLSWRTAPVAVREKLAFREDELALALEEVLTSAHVNEAVLLSTCNRVEVYGATLPVVGKPPLAGAVEDVRKFFSRTRDVPPRQLVDRLYDRTGDEAISHAFRVASALDSMVLGEAQILGQLKAAVVAAQQAGTTGQILGRCMERAFGVAKRVRTETGISLGAANVSTVAVDLARRVFGDLDGKRVLVVGAGKMSAVAVRHLRGNGASEILVTNRSPEKAEALAAEVDGVARSWDDLPDLLTVADVVISSTASPEPVLTKKLLKPVTKRRRYQSIVIIDIAVPRDAEPSIGKLDGVYLFDIDDLERVVAANLKERASEAHAAEKIIANEVFQFRKWLRSQRAVPTIRSLRHHFRSVARTEVDKVIGQISEGNQTNEQREEAIRRLGNIIVNKLLHVPMTALKSGDEEEIEVLVSATQRLFDLPDEQSLHDPVPRNGAAPAAEATQSSEPAAAVEPPAGLASPAPGSSAPNSPGADDVTTSEQPQPGPAPGERGAT